MPDTPRGAVLAAAVPRVKESSRCFHPRRSLVKRSSSRIGALRVLFALALLACGAFAHFEHHLLDPGCTGERGGAHPCTCAASHAGALAAPVVVAAPAPTPRPIERMTLDVSRPAAIALGVVPARGPPTA